MSNAVGKSMMLGLHAACKKNFCSIFCLSVRAIPREQRLEMARKMARTFCEACLDVSHFLRNFLTKRSRNLENKNTIILTNKINFILLGVPGYDVQQHQHQHDIKIELDERVIRYTSNRGWTI
ncbi:MAG: hypothetical protein ACI8RD_010935 [Bacillariaceae sp.]